MDWHATLAATYSHAKVILAGIGFGGSGIGIVKFLNHCPAPFQDQPWWGSFFDTLQDMVSNKRIGERRTRDGLVIPPVPAPKEVPAPVAAPLAPAVPMPEGDSNRG